MTTRLSNADCVGLIRPAIDAHTLGLTALAQLLADCGLDAAGIARATRERLSQGDASQRPGMAA